MRLRHAGSTGQELCAQTGTVRLRRFYLLAKPLRLLPARLEVFIKFLPDKGGNKKPGKHRARRRPLGRMVLRGDPSTR